MPDVALNALVVFLWHFLHVLSRILKNEYLKHLTTFLPMTYHGLLRSIKLDSKGRFTSYVVCPRCSSIYDYESCYEVNNGKAISKSCDFVAFPDHPHHSQRECCGVMLLKKVRTKHMGIDLVPRKTCPYQSLCDAITFMVSKPDFLNLCEHWRVRASQVPEDMYADVYDGKVWKEFQSEQYNHYLNFPGNLLLSLNVDWFQPFSHTQYSVGVIYLVVLNLPREERYKMENIILVGIIPGPKEPKLTLNSYLAPLVLELENAYHGWSIPVKHDQFKTVSVRACIGCVTCDVPATRKVCGFLGHTARLGCSKCLKVFPVSAFGEKPNFAGYNTDNWIPRSAEDTEPGVWSYLKRAQKQALES